MKVIPQLKEYLSRLPDTEAKKAFAERCGTSLPYLTLAANGHKNLGPAIAIAIDRESGGAVRCEDCCDAADFAYLRGTQKSDPPAHQVSAS